MDSSLWELVVAELPGHRCIAPTLPLGAHRRPMRADADLSPRGQARLVAELLEALALEDVTLVGNDTGGLVVQLVAADPRCPSGSGGSCWSAARRSTTCRRA